MPPSFDPKPIFPISVESLKPIQGRPYSRKQWTAGSDATLVDAGANEAFHQYRSQKSCLFQDDTKTVVRSAYPKGKKSPFWYIPLAIFIITASANSVNLTDGLDGLAGIIVATALGAYGTSSCPIGSLKTSSNRRS